jgi:hypothetical protein
MCCLSDPATRPQWAYVQFPQIFRGINKSDIYNAEFKRLYQIIVNGIWWIEWPNYLGTGCFFQRRALYASPSSLASPEIPELAPDYNAVDKPARSQSVLAPSHQGASCNYESHSNGGSRVTHRLMLKTFRVSLILPPYFDLKNIFKRTRIEINYWNY